MMSIVSTSFILEFNGTNSPDNTNNVIGVVFKGVVVLVITAFSGFGNLSVLIILWRNDQMRTITNGIIASLTVSDLFATFICMPVSAGAYFSKSWPTDRTPCIVHMVVLNLFLSSSTLTVSLIALDRLFEVTKIYKLTAWRAVASLVVIWFLSVFFAVPWTLVTNSFNDNNCRPNGTMIPANCHKYTIGRFHPSSHQNLGYFFTRMFICQVLPILVMLFSFFAILKTVRSSDKRIRPATTQVRNLLFIGEIRTAITVMIMIAIYLICLLPLLITIFIAVLPDVEEKTVTSLPEEITLILVWSNCAINPVIYCTRNPNVAAKFCFWRKRIRRNRMSVSHISSNRHIINHLTSFSDEVRSSVIFTEHIDAKIDLHQEENPTKNGDLVDELCRCTKANGSGIQSEV